MSDINLQKVQDLLIEVAHKAGKMSLSARPTTVATDEKKNCKLPLEVYLLATV